MTTGDCSGFSVISMKQSSTVSWPTCSLEVVVFTDADHASKTDHGYSTSGSLLVISGSWSFSLWRFSLRGKQRAIVPRLKLKPLHWPLLCLVMCNPCARVPIWSSIPTHGRLLGLQVGRNHWSHLSWAFEKTILNCGAVDPRIPSHSGLLITVGLQLCARTNDITLPIDHSRQNGRRCKETICHTSAGHLRADGGGR